MIDLSHLTEEEQEMILTVLRRDAELKKAEEERVRKLEKIPFYGSQTDTRMKYLTGEWFYEAKSRRHTDKIHGSEIILASMKQGNSAGLDGSTRIDRSRSPSSRGSDMVPPPKPARCYDAATPLNDSEKENLYSAVRSPRMPRHNPFNRASLLVVDPPENNHGTSDYQAVSQETEPTPQLRNLTADGASQTSGGSIASAGPSAGFRPVPKKRTFLSRRSSSQFQGEGQQRVDAGARPAGVVPAPRRRFQQGSSGAAEQTYQKSKDKTIQEGDLSQRIQPVQRFKPTEDNSLLLQAEASKVSNKFSLETERSTVTTQRQRPPMYPKTDLTAEQRRSRLTEDPGEQMHRERMVSKLPRTSSASSSSRQEASLPQNTADPDPPVSYDLHFIDKSNQQPQTMNQRNVFRLSGQTLAPDGEEEDSIAKVLDWFNRSTDSSDWLNAEDNQKPAKGYDRQDASSKVKDEDLFDRGASEHRKDRSEPKGSHSQRSFDEDKELRTAPKKAINELTETRDETRTNAREKINFQDGKDMTDEGKTLKISHLKSFWEKSNSGPKILISKSAVSGDKGLNHDQLSVEKESDKLSVSGRTSGKINHECESDPADEKEYPSVNITQCNRVSSVHSDTDQQEENLMLDSPQRDRCDSSHPKVLPALQTASRRVSDAERAIIKKETESTAVVKPHLQRDGLSPSEENSLQELLSKNAPAPQPDADVQTRVGGDTKKPNLPRSNLFTAGSEEQVTTKAQTGRGSIEEVKRRDSEDRVLQLNLSPKRMDDIVNKDRGNGLHFNRQVLTHHESTADKIKQLKSFWEQERTKQMFYTGKSKAPGEAKVGRSANQTKLNKRFTKSEFDLTSIGNESGSDEDGGSGKNHLNFTILPLNQRLDKMAPALGTSRAQFNTLREFWGEATPDSRGSLNFDKPKSPKAKEPLRAQLSSQELKTIDSEICPSTPTVEKTRGPGLKSYPSPQSRSAFPLDKPAGSGSNLPNYAPAESVQQKQPKRSSKDSNREEKSPKPQSSLGKEIRPKGRKDSFSMTSSRVGSLRRATSLFTLSLDEEKGPNQLRTEANALHSQSRKPRPNPEKNPPLKRTPEEPEFLIPRARAFVPTDYRHYLGMTDKSSVHTTLAPASKDEGADGKSGYELELGGPVRTSTPVTSEDRHARKSNKVTQRAVWTNYSGSDTGQESPLSSASETWSNSRTGSNRGNDDDEQNPVRKALRRAEARPKNLAKSMEDISATVSPRQERRQEPTVDLRRSIDAASAITSTSPSSFSDPNHLKKMSKSVPSFLQKEDCAKDTDSSSYLHGKLTAGTSMTILSNSSGLTSMSSLSGSVMTMYTGDFVEVQGTIQFSINYVQRLREFHIFVSACRDLAAVDPKRGRSDPYVKSYLVPDKANLGKRKTSVKKKTLNPTFNEILRYRVRMEYLRTQTLILSVWHHDTFGRNSFLGEVDVDLSNWNFDHTQMNYLALKARTMPNIAPLVAGRGEIRLAMRFLPQITHSEGLTKALPHSGEIHIWVKECKSLPLIRASIDPYVKCFVLPDTSRKSRQKTRVLRRTVDPVFNHTMVYDGISEADLTEACVELTVWDRDRLVSNLLGGLRLGAGTGRSYGALVEWMDSGPYEVALWERMIASPNEWVEDVLPLRMLNSAKTAFK